MCDKGHYLAETSIFDLDVGCMLLNGLKKKKL